MNFTAATALELKRTYMRAMADGVDTFEFRGQELVTGYARHLLEYLADKLDLPELRP